MPDSCFCALGREGVTLSQHQAIHKVIKSLVRIHPGRSTVHKGRQLLHQLPGLPR